MRPRHPRSTIFPYTTLFRSLFAEAFHQAPDQAALDDGGEQTDAKQQDAILARSPAETKMRRQHPALDHRHVRDEIAGIDRSEEHTSELQSLRHLVCRLLLEK